MADIGSQVGSAALGQVPQGQPVAPVKPGSGGSSAPTAPATQAPSQAPVDTVDISPAARQASVAREAVNTPTAPAETQLADTGRTGVENAARAAAQIAASNREAADATRNDFGNRRVSFDVRDGRLVGVSVVEQGEGGQETVEVVPPPGTREFRDVAAVAESNQARQDHQQAVLEFSNALLGGNFDATA